MAKRRIGESAEGFAELVNLLAEAGDDRDRFADARALKAFAGSAPVTRASGRSMVITHRKVKNDRLAAAGFVWAFSALTGSTGARAHYDRRRTAGDRHAAATRHLFNRMLGQLYHCLQTGQYYDEAAARRAAPCRRRRRSIAAQSRGRVTGADQVPAGLDYDHVGVLAGVSEMILVSDLTILFQRVLRSSASPFGSRSRWRSVD